MRDTIIKLFNGEINPSEDLGIDKDYKEKQQNLLIAEEKFLKHLNPKQRKLFEEFMLEHFKLSVAEDDLIFTKGFSLGLSLIVEAIGKQ